jgi:hypothetical protein
MTPAKNLHATDLNEIIDFSGGSHKNGIFDEKLIRNSQISLEQNKDRLFDYGNKLN